MQYKDSDKGYERGSPAAEEDTHFHSNSFTLSVKRFVNLTTIKSLNLGRGKGGTAAEEHSQLSLVRAIHLYGKDLSENSHYEHVFQICATSLPTNKDVLAVLIIVHDITTLRDS